MTRRSLFLCMSHWTCSALEKIRNLKSIAETVSQSGSNDPIGVNAIFVVKSGLSFTMRLVSVVMSTAYMPATVIIARPIAIAIQYHHFNGGQLTFFESTMSHTG